MIYSVKSEMGSWEWLRLIVAIAVSAAFSLIGTALRADSFTDTVNVSQGFNVSLNSSPCCLFSYGITPLDLNSSIVGQNFTVSNISVSGTANVTGQPIGGFDVVVLAGSSPFGLPTAGGVFVNSPSNPFLLTPTASTEFHFAEGGLSGTPTTINGTYNFQSKTFTTPCCSVNNFFTATSTPMSLTNGLYVQAFIFTGDPRTNIDLSNLQITVEGSTSGTSVPEPSSSLLIGIGLIGLVGTSALLKFV